MTAEAPTNNCIIDIASDNATITEILTLPFGLGGASSCSPTGNNAVDRLKQTMESVDLSFNVPNHPKLSFFGHYSIESNAVSGKYVVDLPDVRTLLGVQVGTTISLMVGVIFAAIIYRTFLNNNNDAEKRKTSSPSSPLRKGLIGSLLLLASILAPYALIDAMGAESTMIRFTIASFYFLYIFRTLEAIFGFIPTGAKSSWGIYCTYFALPFDMIFDENNLPVMATKRDILNGQINVVKTVSCIIMLCSFLSPYDYKPFGETNAGEFNERIVLRDYLDARHLGNGFAIAVLFQQCLALGFAVTGSAVQIMLGYKVKQSMRNPMLEATSPSDFWGRRWNVLVHAVMKRGVYKPVRKYSSSPMAASLAVFVASGLFHEWLVHAVLMYHQPPHSAASQDVILLGSNTAFFVWNFVVIVLEKILAGSKGIKSLGKMIPSMFIPFLIIMGALPMAHWFSNPYLRGNYFSDYEKCFPLIRKV
mmetsp:Transcript_19077/g.41302  ORF Transcript_19077/g.41302 Transcript_19077/m.41302 type:complete len:476 (+) Transcript_19077:62-1489(+)